MAILGDRAATGIPELTGLLTGVWRPIIFLLIFKYLLKKTLLCAAYLEASVSLDLSLTPCKLTVFPDNQCF